MSSTPLLLYGLQRSGTNYLEALLRRDFNVSIANRNKERDKPEQKHFRLYDQKDIIPEPQFHNNLTFSSFAEFESILQAGGARPHYLIISKDPHSWFLSYSKWGRDHQWPKTSHHYIVEYNLFYKKWLKFAEQSDRIHFLRYRDLLLNTTEVLSDVQEKLGLSDRKATFLNPVPRRVRLATEGFSEGRKVYYRDRLFLQDLSPEELKTISQLLDKEVAQKLGYSPFPA